MKTFLFLNESERVSAFQVIERLLSDEIKNVFSMYKGILNNEVFTEEVKRLDDTPMSDEKANDISNIALGSLKTSFENILDKWYKRHLKNLKKDLKKKNRMKKST